jgi:hypothetical protein
LQPTSKWRAIIRNTNRQFLSPEPQAPRDGLVDSGNLPYLAAFGAASLLRNEYDEPVFETGLDWLLAGIAVEVKATAANSG